MTIPRKLLVPAALGALAWTAAAQDARPVLVEAGRLVVAPGSVLDAPVARMLIRDGKVVAVGNQIATEAAQGARRVRFDGATIVPGFVVAHDQLGLDRDLAESIEPFTPSLAAIDAFDPFSDRLPRLGEGGVTAVGLAPSSKNTFGGLAAVVQWNGDEGTVLEEATYLKIAIVAESLDRERPPTSRMGAADLIRTTFADAANPLTANSPDFRVLRDVLDNSRRVAFHARTHAELTEVLDRCDEMGVAPLLLEARDVDESIVRVQDRSGTIVLAPLSWSSKIEQLELPAKLAAAGIPFSFMGADGDAVRVSAALAVRSGLDRAVALDALTRVPARQCGVDDRIGALRVGRHADFAVFTGDPLDLSSRLLATFVAGRNVYTAPPSAAAASEDGE